jgi:hypothetical protein
MFDLPKLESFQTTKGFFPEETDEQLPSTIQGRSVGSKEEARAVLALEYYGTDYIYHYEFNGGTGVRGGQEIDILAKTVPLWTPIYIQSGYWHGPTQKYEDQIKMREFKKATRAYFRDPIEIWDYELTSIEQARTTMKEKVL